MGLVVRNAWVTLIVLSWLHKHAINLTKLLSIEYCVTLFFIAALLLRDLNERKVTEANLLDLVGSQTYEKWNEFAINLGVQQNIREEIAFDSQRVAKDNFIEVVYRWLSHEDGTGDNTRTWDIVIKALGEIGCPVPLEDLKRKWLQYQKSNGDSFPKGSYLNPGTLNFLLYSHKWYATT